MVTCVLNLQYYMVSYTVAMVTDSVLMGIPWRDLFQHEHMFSQLHAAGMHMLSSVLAWFAWCDQEGSVQVVLSTLAKQAKLRTASVMGMGNIICCHR